MKSLTEILGGSQTLLDISYDIQEVFEDNLTGMHMHRTFLAMLRVIEDLLPIIVEKRAITGRKAFARLFIIRNILEAEML
jgi:pantothenate synthetase